MLDSNDKQLSQGRKMLRTFLSGKKRLITTKDKLRLKTGKIRRTTKERIKQLSG